jgi:hypothetical protein
MCKSVLAALDFALNGAIDVCMYGRLFAKTMDFAKKSIFPNLPISL